MRPHLPIRILIALNILLGILTFSKYGESWDVNSLTHYADSSISMYGKLIGNGDFSPASIKDELALGYYGPAYVMLLRMIDRLISPRYENGLSPLQHFVYFVTFQAGVIAFYVLCLRWMNEIAAFGATLLFSTQPVLWGHAFINPKDIPFLAFFLLTVLFGYKIGENLEPIPLDKRTILASIFFWLIPFLVIFFGSGLILMWIEKLVRNAAVGETNIVSFIASDITKASPEIYIHKYSSFYIRISFFYILISTLVLFFFYYRYSRPAFSALIPVLVGSLLLGFTISIRNLGLFAGLIVSGYILRKHGRNALLHLLFYGLVAAFTVYLLWPYLWINPAGHLFQSFVTMARYPWTNTVLFNGIEYPAADLPASYLPTLLGIQLTEPVWVLFMVGLVVAIFSLRDRRGLLVLTVIWFILPLIGFMIARIVLYDNFRQILFILPPVFFLCGIAFERIKRPWVQVLVIGLCVLPGIIGIVRLYPYEYSYYNSSIGGIHGAFRKFELDYWGTSYREAALWLNENTPVNTNIWAEGPTHLLGIYLRKDLKLYSSGEIERADHYDYVVALSRYNLDLTSYLKANVVYKIERENAVLAVIKKP